MIDIILKLFFLLVSAVLISACSDDDPPMPKDLSPSEVLVINEGKFGSLTASLSAYDAENLLVTNNVYDITNTDPLGDTFQSLTLIGDRYYAVVQSSGYVSVLDTSNYSLLGRIEGLTVPRYLHSIDNEIGYMSTGFGHDTIYKISLVGRSILSRIPLSGITNQIVSTGGLYVIAGETAIHILDPLTDSIIDVIDVGSQAGDLVQDKNGDIWVSCAGQSWIDPAEPATLYKINVADKSSELIHEFGGFGASARMQINGSLDTITVINDALYQIAVDAPRTIYQFISAPDNASLYGLGIDPINSDIYLADAIDYNQNGHIYRMSAQGIGLDTFTVGLIPNGFLFNSRR